PYYENRMRFSQRPIVILAGSLILPPVGLILLWLRHGTSVFRKGLASLAILIAGVAHLFLFYGLHVEFSGGIQPVFTFQSGERHYRQLEAHRAAFQAAAPAIAQVPPAVPAAPLKAESVPAPASGSTYWADFLGPGRLGHYDQMPILTEWPEGGLPQVWKQPVGGGYASFTAASAVPTRRWRPTPCAPAANAGRIPGKRASKRCWAAPDRAPHRCGTMGVGRHWGPRANCAAWKR